MTEIEKSSQNAQPKTKSSLRKHISYGVSCAVLAASLPSFYSSYKESKPAIAVALRDNDTNPLKAAEDFMNLSLKAKASWNPLVMVSGIWLEYRFQESINKQYIANVASVINSTKGISASNGLQIKDKALDALRKTQSDLEVSKRLAERLGNQNLASSLGGNLKAAKDRISSIEKLGKKPT
jgi:hypothetical protein